MTPAEAVSGQNQPATDPDVIAAVQEYLEKEAAKKKAYAGKNKLLANGSTHR